MNERKDIIEEKESSIERKSLERKLILVKEPEFEVVRSSSKKIAERKFINVKERVKKYNERITQKKENLKHENRKENYSFNSIKNYLIHDLKTKESLKESSVKTSSGSISSQNQNLTPVCKGKEAPKESFEIDFDNPGLRTNKISLLKRKFQPGYASPGKRKYFEVNNEQIGSGKRTRKQV